MSTNQEASAARILVVDDRPENLTVLEALLEPFGQPIVKAQSGQEALKMLLTYDFALILLDVQLPDFDGFETAAMIKQREKSRHIPIIFITAISTDIANIFQGYSTGAVDYILKPFNADILRSKVAVFVDLYLKGEQVKAQAEDLRISALREADRVRDEREHELERKHHEELAAAYAREKRIADVLQRSFLLAPPAFKFPEISVATLYEAAWDEANVGGDFFDAFVIGPDKIALAVGDVTGKGLEAAARTAEIKYSLRAFLRECPEPGTAMTRLNRALVNQREEQSTSPESFVCLAVVVWDVSESRIDCACAGCEPPIISRYNRTCEVVELSGMPVGVDVSAEYDHATFALSPGDAIAMFTDGLTEARAQRKFFGQDGITDILASRPMNGAVQDVAAALLSGAKDFAGGRLQDDACLLVARAEPSAKRVFAARPPKRNMEIMRFESTGT